jgi:mannitol-1-phosphate 5-dehydrogenase
MGLNGTRTYVGFGFGAVQAGLFLYEAYRSNAFGRLVVAEVLPQVVSAVRGENGQYHVNIAHRDHIERVGVGPVSLEDPAVEADRQRLIEAIADAEEIGTTVPSVMYYKTDSLGSLHRILAEGLGLKAAKHGPRAVVYTAENHNQAAEILEAHVMNEIAPEEREAVRANVRFLNTVIGKMGGVTTDQEEIRTLNLTTVTPGDHRAFLVEAFNRILISKIEFAKPAFRRGISVFEEKSDLLPFEEAKLYGHNATHALAAYIAAVRGLRRMSELRDFPEIMAFLRTAFLEESGAALLRKYPGLDPLFTPEGYRQYADDLLERMTSPFLRDAVERVGRDVARKLGWHDRLIGTLRMALRYGIRPQRYALGAAAALATMDRSTLVDRPAMETALKALWLDVRPPSSEEQAVFDLVDSARQQLQQWIASGFPELERGASTG